MYNQLGVALRAEYMPFCFELCAPLDKVEELHVANDRDAAILVEDRLPAVFNTYDAQPPMRKPNSRSKQEPAIVRSAMNQRRRHATHDETIWLASTRKVD